MKKLLSIFIFTIFFSMSAMALGTYYGKCVVNVATNSTNYGLVWVTKSENNPPADNAYLTTDNSTCNEFSLSSSITAKFWLYNKPNTGYYLVGWSTNSNGSSPIANSNVQPYNISFSATGTKNSPTTKTYYAVFKEQTVYYDYAHAEVILIDGTGNILKDANDDYIRDGGWVAINEEASDAPIFTVGGTADANIKTYDGDKAEWTYVYYAKADEANDYEFVGWYSATTLNKQLTDYGVIGPNIADNTNKMYSRTYTSTIKYSNKAKAPKAETMYAVFRKTQTYYHYGVSVNIAGDEFEREAKGRVYADNGEAGSNANVASNMWVVSKKDEQVYSQKNKDYTYYYYAKSLDPTKIAFKGWATTPSGEVSYVVAEGEAFSYTHTVTSENMSPEKPYRTPTFYAVFESHYYKSPSVAVATPSLGSGYVHVSLTPSSVDQCTREQISVSDETYQVAANNRTTPYKVYYYAKPRPGAQFVGWSSTPDGLNIISQSPEVVVDCETSSTNANIPHVEAPRYAVFRSDIDIRQQDRMILYVDEEGNGNINDSKVLIDFQKGNTLAATLSGADASNFTLSNRSGSRNGQSITFDATQGLIELVVTYTGDLATAVGKVANVTLSATYGGQTITRPVTIVVEEAPIITFLPTDGKGAYTVKMTNGSGVNYTMDASAKEELKVAVTHESMSNIEMALTADVESDEYYFFGWQMIDEGNTTYLSYDELTTYQFTKAVKVKAEFVHKDIATYSIVGDPNQTVYHDFALVMKDAERLVSTNGMQTVLLNDVAHGDSVKSAILPKGNYTIPANVRFIIPGKGLYDYREDLESTDFHKGTSAEYKYASASSFKKIEHIRWIVEEGTTITISAGSAICVQSMVVSIGADNPNGLPFSYGHIELKENCNLNFLGGSKLISFGYVTGPKSSSIVMNDGSRVKEFLQIYDWRGGTATSSAYLTQKFQSNKIFLINQFFVQNIEAPLTIKAGAEEILEAGIAVGDDPVRMPLTFISQNDGFFQLGNGYSITKYYDVNTDRLQFSIDAENNATGSVELGSITLDISGLGTVSSADYVLPLPHNYDVILGKNTKTNVLYDVAFLPGSTLYVSEGAEVNLGASSNINVFVYDKKYSTINGTGYCGALNKEFYTIKTRPDGIKYVRNSASIQDAKFVVDGIIKTPKGYLYTTNSTSETVDHAAIISNGGGKVVFNSLGTVSNTKQAQYTTGLLGGTIDAVNVPVSPARLLNATGAYQVPSANITYTYVNGLWKANTDETEKPNIPTSVSYKPIFNVTDYTTSAYVNKTSTGTTTIATNNSNVVWSSANLTWTCKLYGEHANQFGYTLGAKSNAVPVTITFTPTSDGVKTATLRVTATYKYTDTYGVAGTYIYSKDIHLTGNASYLNANTLQFAGLSTLFVGQSAVALFNGGNNAQPISISTSLTGVITTSGTTKAATLTPQSVGEVTITATQADDLTNNIAGTTITKRIKVTEVVEWNWGDLYFGTVNTNPVTIHNGATSWTLVEKVDAKNIINLQGTSPHYTATIEDQIAGKYKVTFTYSDNKGVTKDFISTVYTNPRYLRVDVNKDTVFRAVTLSANSQVSFDATNKAVKFESTAQSISQWKMTFMGVPDKINFIPVGTNTWQIEESANGVNWTTSMSWKYLTENEPFEMSLLPSTSYVRISYGAGNINPDTETNEASLKDLYITELSDVKADVKKIYMPIYRGENAPKAVKEVVLTYANTGRLDIRTTDAFKIKFSDSNAEPNDVLSISATTEDNPFGIKGVEVVCYATEATTGELQVYSGSQLVLQIPIHAYSFPQELPIKLATDEPAGGDRYYYVTTHSHNAEWDGTDGVRKITMNNAVSDAAPYVTFAFDGNPTFISFDYTTTAKGTWVIEQSTDGKDWSTAMPVGDDVMSLGKLKRTVSTSSKYIRVIYESDYAEKIEITNLTIVGGASVVVNPTKLQLDCSTAEDLKPKQLTLTAINLTAINIATSSSNFTVTPTTTNAYAQTLSLNETTNPSQLGVNKMGDIVLDVKWTGDKMVEYGEITITNPNDGDAVLATVELTGIKNSINSGNLGIYTGVPSGYTLNDSFDGSEPREVNIDAAFSTKGAPLFDYVVIYGETTTNDGQTIITTPNRNAGSNAKTPYYIYKKNIGGTAYELHQLVENANSSRKAWNQNGDDAVAITSGDAVSMYITGFCPYATTGYTKDDEGVWYFRANAGQSIDVYLQDCYLYSRAKTFDGHTFADRYDGNSFVDSYSRGTGAVLVFACNDKVTTPMNVTIHTLDNNLLKSNYGCFLQSIAGRAFQASSPVQIRLIDDTYAKASYTVLNFTDEWPASQNDKTGDGVRTNGFISLQKQVNNAPSIDMGNANTVVNFNGGQVELQNAQIVSHNYASSLAICPRSGKFAGIFLAYGLGTDDVGGTVNFTDGTTTVQEMWVSPNYFESYLCDKDASGNYITNPKGEYLTTCLRTPTKTFVTGGSHCMMRACSEPTSQGGAPKDKPGNDGKLLGLYKYPKNPESGKKGGWVDNGKNGLVTPTAGNVPNGYKVNSVTPNTNGTVDGEDPTADDYLNFWFDPEFEPTAQPEIDKKISFWKTCMTRIAAEYAGYGGAVGGDTEVEFAGDNQAEIVKNLLYCKLDPYIWNVISSPNYQAPVKNPAPEGDGYIPVHPSSVGDDKYDVYSQNFQRYITNEKPYRVENKVYYITTATADTWMTFTAPFDVANIYVVETFDEATLTENRTRTEILEEQARHNADFASFFAVTIALGQNKTFEQIYNEWKEWAKQSDKDTGLYDSGDYNLRGKWPLTPYTGSNWDAANFYLNSNGGEWVLSGENFTPQWKTLSQDSLEDDILLHKGQTYSMLFPYCVGCDIVLGEDGKPKYDDDGFLMQDVRDYWDYWTGKFLIFESTEGEHHMISGSSSLEAISELKPSSNNGAIVSGNYTFDRIENLSSAEGTSVYYYTPSINEENFFPASGAIEPTTAFLVGPEPKPIGYGLRIRSISYDGKINYASDGENEEDDDVITGGNMPTINGSSDLFVTSIAGGINIAVSEPQYVGVFSATGALLYNGWVETAVDVNLVSKGVYVVVGENNSLKVIY